MKPIETLNEILGNAIKVKILRHLAVGFEFKTGRQLSQIANVSPPAVLKPLRELASQGIVTKTIIGKSHSYSLNKKNILVLQGLIPLFQCEANLLSEFGEKLRKLFSVEVESAIIYGSIARGEATDKSDWDVLFLCQDDQKANTLKETLSNVNSLATQFSSKLDIKIMTIGEYRNKFRAKDALANNIYNDYINSHVSNPLFGKSLTELLKK